MNYTTSKTFDIIPEWDGNAEQDTPIIFHCRYLKNSQLDKCYKIGGDFSIDRTRYIKESIVKIDNLTVNEKPIILVEDFIALEGFGDLYDEVFAAILEENKRGSIKN